jgi:hypothetical protein
MSNSFISHLSVVHASKVEKAVAPINKNTVTEVSRYLKGLLEEAVGVDPRITGVFCGGGRAFVTGWCDIIHDDGEVANYTCSNFDDYYVAGDCFYKIKEEKVLDLLLAVHAYNEEMELKDLPAIGNIYP